MSVLEIISAVLLIISSILIIIMVLFQESKGNGLSGVITGAEMMSEGRSRSKDAILAKYTKYSAIAFFVLAILVGVFSIYLK